MVEIIASVVIIAVSIITWYNLSKIIIEIYSMCHETNKYCRRQAEAIEQATREVLRQKPQK